MIQSFASTDIECFFFDEKVPRGAGWANISKIVRRKFSAVDAALNLADLKIPPGNQLAALRGDLRGYHCVRVNDQWRVIFRWPSNATGPSEVDIVDFH